MPHHDAKRLLDCNPALGLVEVVRVLPCVKACAREGDEDAVPVQVDASPVAMVGLVTAACFVCWVLRAGRCGISIVMGHAVVVGCLV